MVAHRADVPVHRSTAQSSSPLPGSEAWLNALSEGPINFYGGLFALTARQLRAQADFMQGLAEGGNPTDLFNRQVEFIQSSLKSYSEGASRVFGSAVRAAGSNAAQPGK